MMNDHRIIPQVVLGVGFVLLLALLWLTAQLLTYAQGPDGSSEPPSPLLPSQPLEAQLPRETLWSNAQAAEFVLGQAGFTTNASGVTASTFGFPEKAAIDPTTNKVFVSDFSNNRVLRYASWSTLANGAAAEAVLGQSLFTTNATGCTASGMNAPVGVWVDSSGRLWVADNSNHRVLRFDNASTKASGTNADGVLGQPNLTTCSYATAQNKMNSPNDVTVDGTGSLWVVEYANNRVLRFNNAAAKSNGANADGVLGQLLFTTNVFATTQSGMYGPTCLVVDGSGNLFVGEDVNRRVLRFNNAAAKANGANADGVLGQPNFVSNANSVTQIGMGHALGVAVDKYGRLYAADWENSRILIYNNAATLANGAAASNVLGQPNFTSGTANNGGISATSLSHPLRLFFDNVGNRLWVADGWNIRVLRYLELPMTYLPMIMK